MRSGILIFIHFCGLLAIAQGVKIDIPDSLQNLTIQTPRIEFAEREHDFGRFEPVGNDTLKLHSFIFTNTGQEPLVILQAASSCGCTRPTYPKEPILPGDSGVIIVGYRGQGQRTGNFRKSVTVYTNDPRSYTRIFIRGELLKPSEQEQIKTE